MCDVAQGGESVAKVKVKVIEGFNDRTDSKYKEKDSILTVSEERAKKLEGLGLVERVKETGKAAEKKG